MLPSISRLPILKDDHFHLVLRSKDGRPVRAGDPDFADIMVEAIEQLENEDGRGLKSLGVKVEVDSQGYCKLIVRMRRPQSDVGSQVDRRTSAERRAA